ncbi:MAG: TetR family transcriptional regulator [Thalassobius sp.]|nr:TetR family transcriptional regulator [Thalassovita sp.]
MKDEIVKAAIVEASKEVFRQYGYNKVTMDDIAKACGKGRSTLYYYFKNKHEVFEEAAIEEFMDIINPAFKQVKESQTIGENLLGFNSTKLKSIIRKSKEYKHLLTDLRENQDFMTKTFQTVRNKEIASVKQILKWAVEKEEIAYINAGDLDFLAMALVTAISSLEKEMLLFGEITDMSNRMEWLIKLLIKGLK